MIEARIETCWRSSRFMPRVTARKSGASPGGSMVTRMVTKALNRLSKLGIIALVPRKPKAIGSAACWESPAPPAAEARRFRAVRGLSADVLPARSDCAVSRTPRRAGRPPVHAATRPEK